MDEFFMNIAIFQIITDIYDVCIGSALIFGALKWRKGLLATTAFYWGIIIGIFVGLLFMELFDITLDIVIIIVVCSAVIFPILTYHVPSVNRFVLGFLVVMKLLYMFTTYLFKEGNMEFDTAVILPLILATAFGIIFMFMRQLSVLPFALGCVFLGASQVAPTFAKYINQIMFGVTQDYSLLFDPIDFVFALLKIELTDGLTLLIILILMGIGLPTQLKSIKTQGYTYDTPIIVFETDNTEMHGKIIS